MAASRAVASHHGIRIAVNDLAIAIYNLAVAVGDLAISIDDLAINYRCAGGRGRISTNNRALAFPQPGKETEREGVGA